jgi:hypothetical protein
MNFLWGFDPPDQACQVAKIIIMSQQCLAFFLSFLLSSSLFFFFLPSFLSFFLLDITILCLLRIYKNNMQEFKV